MSDLLGQKFVAEFAHLDSAIRQAEIAAPGQMSVEMERVSKARSRTATALQAWLSIAPFEIASVDAEPAGAGITAIEAPVIDTTAAFEDALASIVALSGARRGSPEEQMLRALVASANAWESEIRRQNASPA